MSYTGLLNTVTLSEFTDLTEKEFIYQQEMIKPNALQLYIVDNIPSGSGDTKRYDEVDVETFASLKREGDEATKVQAGVGYHVTMTAKRVATEIEITWEMRNYNKNNAVVSKMTNLTHYCPQRLELDLTHRLTFCSSSTYTDQDGVSNTITTGDSNPLVYATHSLANSSTTYRNRVANDPVFSQGGLEAAETLTVTNVLNNFAEKRVMNFNTIITSPDPNTCRTVKQVLNSTADIDGSNSGVMNYYSGAYRHVILPYLATTATGAYDSTKRGWWFLGAIGNGVSGSWQAYCGIFESNNLKKPVEDEHTDNWVMGSRMSYGNAILNGIGLIGSLPTGS